MIAYVPERGDIDWRARKARKKGRVPERVLHEVLRKALALLS